MTILCFPIADGAVKDSGRDQRPRTFPSTRDRPGTRIGTRSSSQRIKRTLLQPLFKMTQHAMMRKLKIISGLLPEISFIAITWNPESNSYVPREESFPIPLKYIDVTRNTHTSSDVLLEKILMITATWMEKRNLSDA